MVALCSKGPLQVLVGYGSDHCNHVQNCFSATSLIHDAHSLSTVHALPSRAYPPYARPLHAGGAKHFVHVRTTMALLAVEAAANADPRQCVSC